MLRVAQSKNQAINDPIKMGTHGRPDKIKYIHHSFLICDDNQLAFLITNQMGGSVVPWSGPREFFWLGFFFLILCPANLFNKELLERSLPNVAHLGLLVVSLVNRNARASFSVCIYLFSMPNHGDFLASFVGYDDEDGFSHPWVDVARRNVTSRVCSLHFRLERTKGEIQIFIFYLFYCTNLPLV